MLWFFRDRGAIVQVILIPLTVAGVQLFNFRWLAQDVENSWHYLSGAALLFGTYFLWVLGPRSLASEGQSLWLALTWPRGLEELMKAKARLWFLIAQRWLCQFSPSRQCVFQATPGRSCSSLSAGSHLVAAWQRSLSRLFRQSSSSGKPEPIPIGRRWAASLGTFTFAIGVVTQRWQIAVIGIVYSWVTAAAMWQNFRARLPFLFDPWSEKVPPPPTLMHAMIAISILVEGGAVLIGIFIYFVSSTGYATAIALAQALAYGSRRLLFHSPHQSCSQIVAFHRRRSGVGELQNSSEQIKPLVVEWRRDKGQTLFPSMSAGAMGGLLLGSLALGYVALMSRFPTFSEMFRAGQRADGKNSQICDSLMPL